MLHFFSLIYPSCQARSTHEGIWRKQPSFSYYGRPLSLYYPYFSAVTANLFFFNNIVVWLMMFTFRHYSGRNRASKHTSICSLLAEGCERFFPFFSLTQKPTDYSIVLKSLPQLHPIRNIYSGTCDKIFSFYRISYMSLKHQTFKHFYVQTDNIYSAVS